MVSVTSTVDTAHEDMIHDAQMDYYGRKLATCSSDRSVRVFEVNGTTQTPVATLRGHEGPVWQLSWAHPMFGGLLASCSYDRKDRPEDDCLPMTGINGVLTLYACDVMFSVFGGYIWLFQVDNMCLVILWKETNNGWVKLQEFSNHDSSVNSVCWAPEAFGLMLACGSSDGAVSIISSEGDGQWEVKKINNAHTIGCNAVSWAPAVHPGSLFDSAGQKRGKVEKRLVTGGCDNLVKIWKMRDGDGEWKEEEKLEAHSDWVRDVAWAPNIGLPTSKIASCSQDCHVIVWTKDETKPGQWEPVRLRKFNDVVWHLSWSFSGHILAVSGGDNMVTLWRETVDGWICVSDINKGIEQEATK